MAIGLAIVNNHLAPLYIWEMTAFPRSSQGLPAQRKMGKGMAFHTTKQHHHFWQPIRAPIHAAWRMGL